MGREGLDMAKRRFHFTVTFDGIPEGTEVSVVADGSSAEPEGDGPSVEVASAGPPDAVERRIQSGRKDVAPFIRRYVMRCYRDVGGYAEVPDGKRTDSLNLFPPSEYRRKRIASVSVRSGRVEMYCDPSNAEGRQFAQPDLHNGVPVQVKIYLNSDEAIDEAVALTRIAIDERDR